MVRKSSQPALYEVLGRWSQRQAAVASRPTPEKPTRLFGAGRVVRLPIGYVWLAAGALVVIIVGSFSAGYLRGERTGKAAWEQDWLATNQTSLNPPVPPPEVSPQAPEADHGRSRPQPGKPAEAVAVTAWGPIASDPRVGGHNYFVLIHTRRDNAIKLAQFCRDHGVEAYVVRAKNVSLYRVIALPGYAKGERSSEAVRALERRIEDVARNWKLRVNPKDDLAAYPERFDG